MTTSIRILSFLCAFVLASAAMAQETEAEEVEEAVEAAEFVEEMEAPVEPETTAEPEDAPPAPLPDEQADEDSPAAPEAEMEPAEAAAEETDTDGAADTEPAETFVLQGHPVYTPEQAEWVYTPLVEYLNETTPYRFDLEIARDFHRYWLDIRRGVTPDLVLEDAHITAYRINREDYRPLVKAAEPLTFSLLASADNAEATLRDFVGRSVSSMPSPSLGYLVLTTWYDNPMQQPAILSNASSWLDAIEIVFSMEADAAIAPRTLAERYVNMVQVRTSREFPGVTLSASPSVPEDIQEEIREALLMLHDDPDHYSAVHELDIERFVEADPVEYEGLEQWLSGVITFF